MPERYVPGRRQIEAININITRRGPNGWTLLVMTRREGEHVWDVDRMRYEELTAAELLDVVDAAVGATASAL